MENARRVKARTGEAAWQIDTRTRSSDSIYFVRWMKRLTLPSYLDTKSSMAGRMQVIRQDLIDCPDSDARRSVLEKALPEDLYPVSP